MTVLGGATGNPPAAPPSSLAGRPSVFGRVAGFARSREAIAWKVAGRLAAMVPLAALVLIVIVLGAKALPSIKVNGTHFFTGSSWNPGNTYGATVHTDGVAHPHGSSYGIWPIIVGTLETSAIAVVLAVPISLGAAFALTERLPSWLSRPLATAVEILAGIPSVIIGLWGVLTLGPFLADHVYPLVADHVPNVPVLRYFANPTGHGEGLATAGLVLTLMIVPIITATSRDLFNQIPALPKEGAVALGMTDAEVARKISLPWVRAGIIGATVVGLGRALGETIAMAMVTGAALNTVSPNIYGTMGTIAATIVTQLDSAFTDGTGFATSSLAEAALALTVITVAVSMVARLVIARTSQNGLPSGRAV